MTFNNQCLKIITVFSLCLDYKLFLNCSIYPTFVCASIFFFAASEASRKASHVCFLFFSTWGFSFKIYELKKASERRHSQNTDRIQVANSRPPGTRAKREEGQVYCYLTRKIDGKIALFSPPPDPSRFYLSLKTLFKNISRSSTSSDEKSFFLAK